MQEQLMTFSGKGKDFKTFIEFLKLNFHRKTKVKDMQYALQHKKGFLTFVKRTKNLK